MNFADDDNNKDSYVFWGSDVWSLDSIIEMAYH